MRRKGQSGDFLSIGYFLLLLILIGGTIFLMAKVVLGVSYDSRLTDASFLAENVINCVKERNWDKEDFVNLQSICDIKLDGNGKERKMVLSVSVNEEKLFSYGDVVGCELFELSEKNSRCVYSSFYGNLNGEETQFNVVSGSNLEARKDA